MTAGLCGCYFFFFKCIPTIVHSLQLVTKQLKFPSCSYLNSTRTLFISSLFNVFLVWSLNLRINDSLVTGHRCHALHIFPKLLAKKQNASLKQLSGIFLLVQCHRGCSKCCPNGFSDSSISFWKSFWINFLKCWKCLVGLPFNRNDCPAK